MIEVYNKKGKKIGYIKGKEYFDKKNRLIGYLEGSDVKTKSGNILLKLNKHDDIYFGNEQVGYLLNSQVYLREKPIFEFSKEKREIHTLDGKEDLVLIGNNGKINDLDLFAIATIFLESKWSDIIYGYY
jgi:hypothetical protein